MASDPTDALVAGAEQFLAELDDKEFAALVARVRAPGDNAYPSNWDTEEKR